MRYFTPELWLQLGSEDLEQRRKARVTAKKAAVDYRTELEELLPTLTLVQRRFFGRVSLHDATVRCITLGDEQVRRHRRLVIRWIVERADIDRSYVLEYGKIRRFDFDFPGDAFMLGEQGMALDTWGYDEVSRVESGWLRHEILFASGAMARIEFGTFQYRVDPRPDLG